MNLFSYLEQLERLEDRLGALYLKYSEALTEDGELSILFYSLHLEEGAHCRLIRFQRQFLRDRALPVSAQAPDDANSTRLIEQIEALLAETMPPSPERALRTAYEIEFHSAEIHGTERLQAVIPEMVHLLRRLGSGDQNHYSALVQAAHARGIVPAGVYTLPAESP